MILFGTLRNEKTRKIISHLKYFPNAIKDLYRVAELIYDLPHIGAEVWKFYISCIYFATCSVSFWLLSTNLNITPFARSLFPKLRLTLLHPRISTTEETFQSHIIDSTIFQTCSFLHHMFILFCCAV